MEQNGQSPEQGEVLVNGATGGVGSIAIDMLAARGYDVVALTGKKESEKYLKGLGAKRVIFRDELQLGNKPLEAMLWAGAIDNLGGDQLGWTIDTALAWPSYVVFEHLVWAKLGRRIQRGDFDLIHRVTPLSPTAVSPLAAKTDVPMLAGFDVDITRAIPDGAPVALDPAAHTITVVA